VNPLPGLTPDYSDLVLIAKAAGINYRTLIAEILAGALKRLREKKREAGPRSDQKGERTDRIEKIDPTKPTPEAAT
jgi:D-alanine-D-alanine ligase